MALQALWDVPAPAKLNLFLHIVGRRHDGYHLLQSIFVLIDWCDILHLERRSDAQLRRHDLVPALGDEMCLPADDLCLRAARALQQASGCTSGVDISIHKRLPWGAGLGGGSSDAASTLLALNRLWGLHWPRDRLQALALTLGADVPFFIGGQTAFVEGVGERLTPVALPPQWLAVVKPAQGILTASIFASPLLERHTEDVIVQDFVGNARLCHGRSEGYGGNDLQAAAQSLCPAVSEVSAWLDARFGNSRMTGSGSAVFARAGTGDQPVATWGVDELPRHWVGRMCRSLDHHPLVGWAG